jgi:excisionase family DNA binding protein
MKGAAEATVLTVEQLAARWVVDVKTIYAAVAARQITALRLGRVIRIPLAVVKDLETQGCVVPGGSNAGSTR